MKTAAEYRAMADECFKWAREAQQMKFARPTCSSHGFGSMLRLNSTAFHRPGYRLPQPKQLKRCVRRVKANLAANSSRRRLCFDLRLIGTGLREASPTKSKLAETRDWFA